MGVIEKIKSVLGLGGSGSADGTDVTVEHEPNEPAAAGTDAAGSTASVTKEPPADADSAEPAEVDSEAGNSSATDTTATESVNTAEYVPDDSAEITDSDAGDSAEISDSSSGESVGGTDSDADSTDVADSGLEEPTEAPAADVPDSGEQPVETVSGIGPAYAKRLEDAGIGTVAELLEADVADLADETDLSEKRINRWRDRAKEL